MPAKVRSSLRRRPDPPRRTPVSLPAEPPPPLFPGSPRLLLRAEVAELLGISVVSLWQWERSGRLPRALNLHGKPVWRSDVIEQFVASLPVRKLKGDADAV